MAKDATRKNSKTGIFKKGNFKVTSRADIPWYERVDEIDRGSIDKLAREYEDAKPNGSVLRSDERTGKSKDASRRGNSDLDRRYSLGFLTTTDTERLLKSKQLKVRRSENILGM